MNLEEKYNGLLDEDIIESGIEDAKRAREIIKNMDLDVIYCSPMLRAKHTCEIINVNNVPVIYDDRLKERTLGENDGKTFEEAGITLKDFCNYYYKSDVKGFEDLPTLFNRVHSLIDELRNKNYKNVLIVAHGGILRAIFFYFNEIPENGALQTKYKKAANCQIESYEL